MIERLCKHSGNEYVFKRRRFVAFGAAALLLPLGARANSSQISEWVVRAFEGLGSDLSYIERKAFGYSSTFAWRSASVADVGAVGGTACAVPVAAYAALPAEFAYLIREIYNSAMGLGFLVYGKAEKDDFANILAVWSDELNIDDETLSRVYEISEQLAEEGLESASEYVIERAMERADSGVSGNYKGIVAGGGAVATSSRNKAETKMVSKVLAKKGGTKVAGKLSTKVATKTGAKIAGKYVAKASLGWIPIVSAVACAGINGWIMNDILDAASRYYSKLNDYRERRYRLRR